MMHTQDLFPINEFGRPGRGFGRALTPALLALLALPAAAAPSLLLSEPPGWNGWTVSGTVKAGYREHGGAREALTTASQTRTITPFGATPGEVIALAPLSASRLPTSGAAKDKAEGSLGFTYRVGGGAVPDTFTIDLNATTSAMTAVYDFGDGTPVPADAYFEATLVLETYAPLAGAVLRLPDMPIPAAAAPSTESLVAQITAGPTLGFFLPGHAGIDYPLTLAPAPGAPYFRYELTYSVTTPFGADPEVAYRLTGGASAAPAPPAPPLTAAEDSVRREMPKVRLNKLVYDSDDPISATVVAQQAADFAAHNTLVLVCPETGDIEKITLAATGDPLRQAGAGVQLKTGGGINPFDGVLVVPPGRPFSALYSYTLSQRITEDLQAGLKKSEKLVSADFGLAFDPAPPGVSVQVTPPIAIGGTAEENPPPGAKRTGTLAVEGMPGIVQIASDELIVAPLDAAHAAEFAARAGATYAENDAEWRGPNATPVWHRAVMADTAQAEAARQARVRYLPQLLALAGRTGHLHASNQRVLGLFATGLELWLEGFPCAVNPKAYPDGQLRAPEGRDFSRVASGGLPNPFDSMTSPQPHYDDPLQNLRDLWAEVAMHDLDGEVVQVAFIDSAFAPNPDFRGYPDAIPQFDMETGERGPHVAEKPEQPVFVRTPVWHGNGTVAVAGAVMGNRYGVAGVAGQIMQPMLYYMG
ncbi:MAG: hypothetical protein MUF04_04415, partial [Akkermansiaceae bacterium]|nr:hypothetical protein [Akkermansiaceae bacterium]